MLAKKMLFVLVVFFLIMVVGCATSVRDAVKIDTNLPVGKIEGNQFAGIRYPFNVSAPPNWTVSMTYPSFMVDLGYEKSGLEESEVFVYNPATQSNLQIDFLAVDRYSQFSQASIEALTSSVGGGVVSDTEEQAGTANIALGPTEPVSLKGVQYAAKKYVTFDLKGVRWQQGWVYAFTEPYQIFILYMMSEKEGSNDLNHLKTILDSFEVVSQK
ncbi:MAG: hypothetical protein MUO29_04975 [Desulfobacterales bacterium]|nr:hypothetical protein [Desulfobacterales bacterium]